MGKKQTKKKNPYSAIAVFSEMNTTKERGYLCAFLQGTENSSLSVLCSGTRSAWSEKPDSWCLLSRCGLLCMGATRACQLQIPGELTGPSNNHYPFYY